MSVCSDVILCCENSPISSAKIEDRFVYQHRSSQVRPRRERKGRGKEKEAGDRKRRRWKEKGIL
jgi:hypothetical protein